MNRPQRNVGVVHGEWGEQIAVWRLRLEGLEIIERNARPCPHDRRLEIDIIAYDREADAMVFVEVKQHASHAGGESRIRSVDKAKLRNLRTACNAWRRGNSWHGNYRFDVIEVFGTPNDKRPEVDHVRNVNLFVWPQRFVRWL